jgi:di/tricarboxylate transporter
MLAGGGGMLPGAGPPNAMLTGSGSDTGSDPSTVTPRCSSWTPTSAT